jgi:hypothetical protein
MAAPNATGTAALLTQHYKDLYGKVPLSATLKATIIHTAAEAGNVGPDYIYGWGVVDGAAAAKFLDAAKKETSGRLIKETYSGSIQTQTITSSGAEPLKATIVWTDPAGQIHGSGLDEKTRNLVNDLDIWIEDSSGKKYYPWTLNPDDPSAPAVRSKRNELDNVEQVLIDNPAPGTYTVHVGHSGNSFNQNYSLLISGIGEPKSTITLTTADQTASETSDGSDPAQFIITRSGGDNSKAETIRYKVSGTADNNFDYDYLSGEVTIEAGKDSAVININPIDDSEYEGTENVILTIESSDNYDLGSTIQASVQIQDNDPEPKSTITLTAPDKTASETSNDSNPARFIVTRSDGDNSKAETIRYTITGDADNGIDYDYLSGEVTIEAGQDSAVININPTDDSEYEGTESVTLTIESSDDYDLGNTIAASAQIQDNDPEPKSTITLTAPDKAASETSNASNPAQFIVTRSDGDNSKAETIRYTITGTADNGVDYDSLSGEVTIEAGQDSAVIDISPIDDTDHEPSENVTLKISSSSDYELSPQVEETVWIDDNDPIKSDIRISKVADAAETTAGTSPQNGRFLIYRINGSNEDPETIYYTLSGTAQDGQDYIIDKSITIPANQDYVFLDVTPINDGDYTEGTETVIITLQENDDYNLGSMVSETVNILDAERPKSKIGVVTVDASATETQSGETPDRGIFRIIRTGADNSQPEKVYYTVTGSANNGEDYEALSGEVIIPSGSNFADIIINPKDDGEYESPESITIQLDNDSEYELDTLTQDTVWLYDNDPQPTLKLVGVTWDGELYEVDLESNESRLIGSTQFNKLNSLAHDSQGNLLTIANVNSSVGEVIRIDPSTGVGEVYKTFDNDFGGKKASIRGLTALGDNNLYAIHNTSGNDFIGNDALYRISLTTGQARKVADLGYSGLQSLALSSDGILYSFSRESQNIVSINIGNGETTEIPTTGVPSQPANIQGLTFTPDGELLAVFQLGTGDRTGWYRVDVNSGEITPMQIEESIEFRGVAALKEQRNSNTVQGFTEITVSLV